MRLASITADGNQADGNDAGGNTYAGIRPTCP